MLLELALSLSLSCERHDLQLSDRKNRSHVIQHLNTEAITDVDGRRVQLRFWLIFGQLRQLAAYRGDGSLHKRSLIGGLQITATQYNVAVMRPPNDAVTATCCRQINVHQINVLTIVWFVRRDVAEQGGRKFIHDRNTR